ncbi:uncharacterized protein LOC134755015 [Cydia strobilella]|uniref:uncharacterized protein LOC134755015 n=1 Tax=Cydia strobilella TaxID=1100964 RepID=UPI003003D941
MLIKKPNASWCSRVCREVHKQFLISERHPLIFDYLRSYLALVEERRRYFLEGRSVIHPLSMFSLFWKSLMVFVNLAHIVASTLRFCIITDAFNMLYVENCDIVLMVIQVICLIDIIICFNIGILKSKSALIVLDRRRIARVSYLQYESAFIRIRALTAILFYRAYVFSYFLPDLISSTPVSFVLLMIGERSRKDMLIPDILPLARGTGFNMFKTYHETEIVVNSFIMLLGAMFKMYSVVYWLQTYMTVYNSTLRYQELLDQVEKFMSHHQFPGPLMRRLRDYYGYRFQENYYKESVALGYLSGASVVTDPRKCPYYKRPLKFVETQLRDEIHLNTYQILADKVAVLKNLPPAFLGRVMGYLELEIFLPDDLVFHVGDLCKHVYFVCTGTLALYTVKGVEGRKQQPSVRGAKSDLLELVDIAVPQGYVIGNNLLSILMNAISRPDDAEIVMFADDGCVILAADSQDLLGTKLTKAMHFDDGDFVGGVSLLTLSTRRVTTLVAIEITHTYRLSFEHLRELAKLNTSLLDRIKKETFKRFTEITHIDELILREGSPTEDN